MTTHTLANKSKLIQLDKNTNLCYKLSCAVLLRHQQMVQEEAQANSPWGALDNWRLAGTEPFHVELVKLGGAGEEGRLSCLYKGGYLYLNGMLCDVEEISGSGWGGLYAVTLSGQRHECHVLIEDDLISVLYDGEQFTFQDKVMQAEFDDGALSDGRIVSPLPGVVAKVVAQKGQAVKEGDALVIIEAMKTEHTLQAPFDGMVSAIHYNVGDYVEKDAELVSFEDAS